MIIHYLQDLMKMMLLYCDDVKVPWERVFIYKDTDTARAQFQDTYAF